jgi:long-chain acyl-CoA synthetase
MRRARGAQRIGAVTAHTFPRTATVAGAFLDTVARDPDGPALRTLDDSTRLNWRELHDRVAAATGGLRALGIRPGDTVALLSANRPELWIADLAVTLCGATTCAVYTTLPPHDVEYVLRDAGVRVALAERALIDLLPSGLEHIVALDGDEGVTLRTLEALAEPADLHAAAAALAPGDVATLIYTSGTTAHPKGVELTHAGLMAALHGWQEALPLADVRRIISWLPPAHVMDRVLHFYLALDEGFETTTCPDPRQIARYLAAVRPHMLIAVPRVWEKLKGAVEPALAGGAPPAALRERVGLDQLVFAGVGAAPIALDVIAFFHAIGIPLRQGYALSEAGCAGTVNRVGSSDPLGSVGHPLPGTELRLAPDGEVLLRGAATMAGYRNQPEATAEAIDADGWLHTGDIGALDAGGALTLVGRKKEIIITAGGKNIAPARVEAELKAASPLIAHACAVGDRRPYVTALLVLDPEATGDVAAAVAKANERLARVEQVKRFTVLPGEWRPGGPELTPTQKLRRHAVLERYAAEIDAMY